MKSRELVVKTLEFDSPERIPRQLWLLPCAEELYPHEISRLGKDFPDDIVYAPAEYDSPLPVEGDAYKQGIFIDEWGCKFENKQSGYIGEVKEPLVADWNNVSNVKPPVEMLSFDNGAVNSFCRGTDKFVLATCCPRPFERMQFIRTTYNTFFDVIDRPEAFTTLLRSVHEFYLKEFELWARTDVDGLMFMDDWGAQQSLLISPDLWRTLFKPFYRDYISVAHDHGKYCFMHSDGFIIDIIPDLIELGLDALNSQIFCMGVETLGERFRGRLTFWGEIDRQHILPYSTVEEVAGAVRSVKDSLYDKGGAIAQCEFGPGALPENVYAVFETWAEM